jgi:membrane fusion protein, copper/silver efflux system
MKKYWRLNKAIGSLILGAILFLVSCREGNNKIPYTKNNQSVDTSRISLIMLDSGSYPLNIHCSGYIDYNPSERYSISARVSGRIEKLYAKSPFQHVSSGEPVYSIYSPELLTAENNYLQLLSTSNDPVLIDATFRQLINLGLTKVEIEKIKSGKKVNPVVTIYSPVSGHLHMESDKTSGGMNSVSISSDGLLKEGDYISKGQTLFNIYRSDKVWAILKIYANDVSAVKLHQPVKIITQGSIESIAGKINFIEPTNKDNMTAVRVYLDNPGDDLRVGTLVQATINAGNVSGYWLPVSAVLDLGENKIALVQKGNAFEIREVHTGISDNTRIQIIGGIQPNEKLAKDARYIYDSDTFIKNN